MTADTTRILSTRGSILSSGYVTLDVVIDGKSIAHRAGGTAANVAANLAYLGWNVDLAAAIGRDPAGDHVYHGLAKAGVQTSYLARREGTGTPVVIHEIRNAKHRFLFGCPECGRRFPRHRPLPMEAAEHVASSPTRPDVFFFDRVSPAMLVLARSSREAGQLVVFEPSTRGRAEHFELARDLAHIVKCSRQYLPKFGDLLRGTPRRRQVQIITNGARGVSWRAGSTWRESAGFKVPVVDSGGAGDWMTAAMLAAMPSLKPKDLPSLDLEAVLRTSQAVAAVSCGAVGARGVSEVLVADELRRAVADLVGSYKPFSPPRRVLHRTRRRAMCRACLA